MIYEVLLLENKKAYQKTILWEKKWRKIIFFWVKIFLNLPERHHLSILNPQKFLNVQNLFSGQTIRH